VSLGIRGAPDIRLIVRRFEPCDTDVLDRKWTDGNGQLRSTPLEPFAIDDTQKAWVKFRDYLYGHCMTWAEACDMPYRLVATLYAPGKASERPVACSHRPLADMDKATSVGRELLEHVAHFALAYCKAP